MLGELTVISGSPTIVVIGLGYVGLPLAVALSRKFSVLGYDIDPQRISELRAGKDRTLEVGDEELRRPLFSSPTSRKIATAAVSTSSPFPPPWTIATGRTSKPY